MKNEYRVFLLTGIVLLGILLCLHPWLFFPLFHLRPILLGLLPAISFFPPAIILLKKLRGKEAFPSSLFLVYGLFTSLALTAATAFVCLTIHLDGVLGISLVMILLFWSWWKRFFLENAWRWKVGFFSHCSRVELTLLTVAVWGGLAAAVLPPVGYDAHEYHLRVPEQYLNNNGWVSFPYNVYGAFPMNVEMLYLWPLAGQSPAGCTSINLMFALLTALAIWQMGVLWGFGAYSLLAPSIFLSTGIVQFLIVQADIDLALSASAAVLLLAYERFRLEKHPIDAVMISLALGFAFGCKYIAALSIGIPFLAILIVDCKQIGWQRLWIPLGWAAMGAILLFLPWAFRNALLYGNPFYPLLIDRLGGTPPIYQEAFRLAHAPNLDSFERILRDFFVLPFKKSFAESLPNGFSCLWVLGIPALRFCSFKHPLIRSFVFAATAYIGWFFLTQHNDRFLASLLPLMALFGAIPVYLLIHTIHRRVLWGLVMTIAVVQLYGAITMIVQRDTVEYLLMPTLESNYMNQRMPHYRAIEWLNREWEKQYPRQTMKVLFVGEAQSYGARFDAIVPTVFNHHPLETGLDDRVTHILYNSSELNRLQKGYGPLGWPLGDYLRNWIGENQNRLRLVYDAYPEKPGIVVVYEIIR